MATCVSSSRYVILNTTNLLPFRISAKHPLNLLIFQQYFIARKYLRDAERKYYTLQSFKGTLEAVEQQTNMMKLVTDSEARLKYLMTVYKIWEHGVHKLNRDVEKLNKLLAEAYRVTLRKLEVCT